MFKKSVTISVISTIILTSALHAESGIKIEQPSNESKAKEVAITTAITTGAGVGTAAAVLSAAGIAAVPHAAGGMILISTAGGASYIAGTLGIAGAAVACVASVACALTVAGGAAIAIGGGYYAWEAYASQKIELDDVLYEDETIFFNGNYFTRIKDKFITPEKRKQLIQLSKDDKRSSDYYVLNGVLLHWGYFNHHYYVRSDHVKELKSQFKSGGLYEVDAKDVER